ncbi:MAG: hypothetical protein KME20_15775 [Kaiparowitsia implicata GSE-PSE-MK54-09C]|jgi:hypothetical protein|nr:hypothetical protein [Kaiparowitsia implicata GSE-PSE-MK54-09C]
MKIENPRYVSNQVYPTLEMEVDGKTADVFWEMKPGMVRSGLIRLGSNFGKQDLGARLDGRTLTGFTSDRTVFRLAIAFGLEVYHGRFKEGPAVECPDANEVKELGDRLKKYALDGAPSWEDLTAF